ncbi:hypothetical protein QVD17_19296 [Tagetes erecta]|uniref:Uncharacterized protein n=1 Tax=Tagetes erecta TaxID=13708 RepID=A0AAD8KQQ4_TARER|nr:hypothetical protein QVD17_19296 [Tagetes erecta]
MHDCNPVHVPMDPNVKYSKAEDEPETDDTNYRKVVGCLRYLTHSRPDLSYSVGIVSRYMQSPRESHAAAIKQILRYVKGTVKYGIVYPRKSSNKIHGYSDSSFNIDQDDGRSTTGHVFYYGVAPITWCSQKQGTVALSSCEAKYMAASAATCQAMWLREMISEITGDAIQKVILKVDNTSAIALVKNPVFHDRIPLNRFSVCSQGTPDGNSGAAGLKHLPETKSKCCCETGDSTFHTRLSLTKSSPHSYVRYGHEHLPGSARAIRYCAPSIPFEATPLLSHIGDSLRVTVLV